MRLTIEGIEKAPGLVVRIGHDGAVEIDCDAARSSSQESRLRALMLDGAVELASQVPKLVAGMSAATAASALLASAAVLDSLSRPRPT